MLVVRGRTLIGWKRAVWARFFPHICYCFFYLSFPPLKDVFFSPYKYVRCYESQIVFSNIMYSILLYIILLDLKLKY